MNQKANLLGDVRAEADAVMLNLAFYETPDYKTLLEASDKSIVVGRRGTGKSALSYMLTKYWAKLPEIRVINLAADEDQIIGLRPLVELFGSDFRLVRAGARVAWRYAILMEIAVSLSSQYKYGKSSGASVLDDHIASWRINRYGFCARLKDKLRQTIDTASGAERRVGDLAQTLDINAVEDAVRSVLAQSSGRRFKVLIDRLDEGYEPDSVGIGLIDGLVNAVVDINARFEDVHVIAFLRDNIFRAVAKSDPDFTRNIEGQELRLHWDEYSLFTLVANRLRAAFSLAQESTVKVWDQCVARDLMGSSGFRKCLRLTLYRPRDVLMLLNNAFRNAGKQSRTVIVDADVEATAKSISVNRLEDLEKEYSAILPGLPTLISAFANRNPELTAQDARRLLEGVMLSDTYPSAIQQQFAILESPVAALRELYGIGFLGAVDEVTKNFVFSHDGHSSAKELESANMVLVHPCYWMALNATRSALNPDEAEQIYDEYDIEVSSDTPVARAKRIGQVMAALNQIPEGQEGASEFEEWCLRAVRVIRAGPGNLNS